MESHPPVLVSMTPGNGSSALTLPARPRISELRFRLCQPVAFHVRDPYLADLTQKVTFPQPVECTTVTGIAAQAAANAELSFVPAVVDELVPAGAGHLPDQHAVRKYLVAVIGAVVLPRHVVLLGVVDSHFCGRDHDALRSFPRVEVFKGLLRISTKEVHTGRH